VCGPREVSVLHSITVINGWITWTWGNHVPDDLVVTTSSFKGSKKFGRLGGLPGTRPPRGSTRDFFSTTDGCWESGHHSWRLLVIEVEVQSTNVSQWTVKEIWSTEWSLDDEPKVSFQSA